MYSQTFGARQNCPTLYAEHRILPGSILVRIESQSRFPAVPGRIESRSNLCPEAISGLKWVKFTLGSVLTGFWRTTGGRELPLAVFNDDLTDRGRVEFHMRKREAEQPQAGQGRN